MKPCNIRSRGHVFSVGNYLMTGKILGKGHFASVEEATHRIIGKKVAIKIIDLTSIKEEYARRNLHREPRVMAKLRHPCIAALYETMMHGPRLFVVMEAAGGGDLCAYVLAARGARAGRASGGLPEARARPLAAQLVSAVRHMHAKGVVHRDLKMENIMLDATKHYIKIVGYQSHLSNTFLHPYIYNKVQSRCCIKCCTLPEIKSRIMEWIAALSYNELGLDFGLSNLWCAGAALRTPCGSLEYAAPELFLDGRRYGPEVDLWSIGVIVYGMVTGGLPFAGDGGEGASRPQLRAAIARGFTRKQRVTLACVSTDCKTFIQHLLEPNVEMRMKIEEAARHRWIKRPGMRMKMHPFGTIEPKISKEIHKQIAELCGETTMDIAARIKAEPFGATAGMYNIKCHIHQLQSASGADLLWSPALQECKPQSPPEYRQAERQDVSVKAELIKNLTFNSETQMKKSQLFNGTSKPGPNNGFHVTTSKIANMKEGDNGQRTVEARREIVMRDHSTQSPRLSIGRPLRTFNKPIYKVCDNGDCSLDPRLPSIDEHSNAIFNDTRKIVRNVRLPLARKVEELSVRLNNCPNGIGDSKRSDFYRKAGDGLHSWRTNRPVLNPPPKILLQSHATTIKRASLGNIVSPHSSSNSHCKSERSISVGWYSNRSPAMKDTHLQRLRKASLMK